MFEISPKWLKYQTTFCTKSSYILGPKGTFKYHMTLRERGLAQTVRVPSYGGRVFSQIVIQLSKKA